MVRVISAVEHVAYGRPASDALARAVEGAKTAGPLAPVTVIVPSNFAGLTARRLLGSGELGLRGIANVAFLTPFRLAELLSADQLLGTLPLTSPVLGAAIRAVLLPTRALCPRRRPSRHRGGVGGFVPVSWPTSALKRWIGSPVTERRPQRPYGCTGGSHSGFRAFTTSSM